MNLKSIFQEILSNAHKTRHNCRSPHLRRDDILNEIDSLFPTTSASVFDSLKDDVTTFGDKASDSVEQRIDESIDTIVDKTNNELTNEINSAGEKVSE